MYKTETRNGYEAPGDDVRGEGTSSERYLDTCSVTVVAGRPTQVPQKKPQSQQKYQAKN